MQIKTNKFFFSNIVCEKSAAAGEEKNKQPNRFQYKLFYCFNYNNQPTTIIINLFKIQII